MKGTDPTKARRLRIAWTGVFVANLPVPLLFSLIVTDWGAQIGTFAGIALLYLLGLESCQRVRGLSSIVIPGGWIVAVSQFFPFLQFLAGARSLEIGHALGLGETSEATGVFGGCIVTLLTRGMLLGVAAVIMLFVDALAIIVDAPHPSTCKHRRNGRVFGGRTEINPSVMEEPAD